MPAEEIADRAAHIAGAEAAAFHFHIFAEQQGLDDRRIRRWPADAVFLQRLHQRRFGEARRRLGEVLVGVDAVQRNAIAGLHRRQLAAFVIVLVLLVLAFLVHGEEARIDHRRAAGAEAVVAARRQIHRHGVQRGRHHLRGDRALPDQFVQAALVVAKEAADLGRRAQRGRGTHGFMRFLRVLGFGLVEVWFVGQRLGAEIAGDDVAQLAQRFGRQAHRVGTHVADQADCAFFANHHAFVQLLRNLHGALGGEAEFARGFLLQRGGGERRRRPALALLADHIGDLQHALRRSDDSLARGFGGVAIGDRELFELLAVEFIELGGERLRGVRALGFDAPVLAGDEGFDLFLALHDHAQRRRLHAAGGQAALHLAPQHRRQIEADQIVECSTGLLGVDQINGDRARFGHRFLDRPRGDFGEHHPLQSAVLEQAAFLQDLGDVPADRLAFAVRVGREVEVVSGFRGLGDGLDVFLVLLDQLIAHGEVLRRIHGTLFGHQVTDVAIGGEDVEVLA